MELALLTWILVEQRVPGRSGLDRQGGSWGEVFGANLLTCFTLQESQGCALCLGICFSLSALVKTDVLGIFVFCARLFG